MRIVHIQLSKLTLHLTLYVQQRWNCGVKRFVSASLKISTMRCPALRVRIWIIRNSCLVYLVLQQKSLICSPASALLLEQGWLQWLYSAHRTHCCPLPQWWERWCTACLFSCSLFFPSLSTASPTSGTQVDGGEGEAGSSLRQNFHHDQRVSMSWDCVTTPTETMQEAVPFTQWQYMEAVSVSTNK